MESFLTSSLATPWCFAAVIQVDNEKEVLGGKTPWASLHEEIHYTGKDF